MKLHHKNKLLENAAIIVVAIMIGAGCASTNPWPSVTQTAVFIGVGGALQKNHDLRPKIEAATTVVCAVAEGTNANPVELVKELNAAGPWTFAEWAVINGVVIGAVNIAANANTNSSAQPYIEAACQGLTLALATSPPATGVRNLPPVKATWPQLK